MATIQLPVKVLDDKCINCKALDLTKNELYADIDKVLTEYSCSNLHLCMYIRNRIVRNEPENNKEVTE